MRCNLIDLLLTLACVGIVLLIFAFFLSARADDPEAVLTDPPTVSAIDSLALTIPRAPEPTPWPTPEPTDKPVYNPAIPLSNDLQIVLREACDENGVELAPALGIIEVESDFDPTADNGLCYGLMQLNRRYFPDNLPPGENIVYGVEYLVQLLARYETLEAALCAYNAGHDTRKRGYSNAVLAAAEKWGETI